MLSLKIGNLMMSISNENSKPVHKIHYDAQLGQIYKIWILNLILSFFTLGIYSFWGRTRLRKYIARCLSLQNDRFEYTGKGKELFLAFLRISGIFAVLGGLYFATAYIVGNVLNMPFVMDIVDTILRVVYLPILFFLVYAGTYGALRYRLSKTRWRGIRFHLSGSSFSFASFALGRALLNVLSFGMLIPKSALEKESRIINNMSYGSLKFSMNYHTHNLNKLNIITMLLAIPTLAFSRIWFHVALQRFIFEHTSLGDIRFNYTMKPSTQFFLALKGFLLLILTLGLGYPIIVQMNIRTLLNNMELMGDLDSLKVHQSEQPELTVGEGLESVFGESLL
jgi:uncharacterized membrane protein YjgN (DUF898 family)